MKHMVSHDKHNSDFPSIPLIYTVDKSQPVEPLWDEEFKTKFDKTRDSTWIRIDRSRDSKWTRFDKTKNSTWTTVDRSRDSTWTSLRELETWL